MKQFIDIENWKRKEYYNFFKGFDEPFFGIGTDIDCTAIYKYSKEHKESFFLLYLYYSLVAANRVEEFRLRIEDNQVALFDSIHASTTINSGEDSFSFCFLKYFNSFEEFKENALLQMEKVRNAGGLGNSEDNRRTDVIHYTSLPWIKFNMVTHPRAFSYPDSIPKITFGKLFERDNKYFIPVLLNAHHSLMDGYHAGRFFNLLEELYNEK